MPRRRFDRPPSCSPRSLSSTGRPAGIGGAAAAADRFFPPASRSARSRFLTCCMRFLSTRCCLATARSSNLSTSCASVDLSSISQGSESSLARLYPHAGRHSWASSSHTMRSLFLALMPRSWANFCHLVSGLGLGTGFSRGSRSVGSGSLATGPQAEDSVGRSKTRLMSSWMASRPREVNALSLSWSTLLRSAGWLSNATR
mmetsp:Transcript_5801/g.18453  ORF Transcript_5801/g.18453 Transcript_5801/m.18453 type:complete len:201 (-) Transcript_5801:119-721(-)